MKTDYKQELWPYVEANRIIKRYNQDKQKVYLFETGFGPSGLPHIGTFGEVVRTYFIILAMRDLGYKTRLISFSDDMDGLRKVPEDFPRDVDKFLGKPVSMIPDPFNCCNSFAEHMNNKLKMLLDSIAIEYEFRSATTEYKKGTFNEALSILIQDYRTIEEIILPTLSEETRQSWFPFLPICKQCRNVLTTRVTNVSKEKMEVEYSCDKKFDNIFGCGYEGVSSVLDGNGKMTWKIDWALRWKTFGVDYEIYGKDLIESFEISKQIMKRVFRTKEPEHMFYEMFLDEDGSKISKSKGKGLSVEDWLKYGTYESLLYLMFDKPRKAKELSVRIIPRYMNEVGKLIENHYVKREPKDNLFDIYNFLTFFKPPQNQPFTFDYSILCNLISAIGVEEISTIKNYIFKTFPSAKKEFPDTEIERYLNYAIKYYRDFLSSKFVEAEIDLKDAFLLGQLFSYLESDRSDEDIHNAIYDIASKNNYEPKNFFTLLYNTLLKQERGPRLGHFINLLGNEKVREIINKAIGKAVKDLKKAATLNQEDGVDEKSYIGEKREYLGELEKKLQDKGNFVHRKVKTKKLYYESSYLKKFRAKVTDIKGNKVFLDQTAFYPRGGGQVGDQGTINSCKVIDTIYDDIDIAHVIDGNFNLTIGQEVECSIDWEKRYRIMKLHSASHIMEYFLFKTTAVKERLGSNVDEKADRSTYSLHGNLTKDDILKVEENVNRFIAEKHEISCWGLPDDLNIRIWKSGNIEEKCGGTHPHNTYEIGKVVINRKSGGKNAVKIVTILREYE